jgi:hypothetical protein
MQRSPVTVLFFLFFYLSRLADWFCSLHFPTHTPPLHAPFLFTVSDLPNRIDLQINPPRLQMVTRPSADKASFRYPLCDCHGSL